MTPTSAQPGTFTLGMPNDMHAEGAAHFAPTG
jgi:hypothetical protein